MQFILLLDGHKPPDHCTIARFRSGEDTAPAIEDLFYQYAMILEREGLTNHSEVFIDGTKIESKANRYTFVWRKCVERQLAKIKAAAKGMLGLEEGYVTKRKLEDRVQELNQVVEEKGLHAFPNRWKSEGIQRNVLLGAFSKHPEIHIQVQHPKAGFASFEARFSAEILNFLYLWNLCTFILNSLNPFSVCSVSFSPFYSLNRKRGLLQNSSFLQQPLPK